MKLSGAKIIPLPQTAVWAALNDPETLRQSIPGCESFETTGPNAFQATVASRIGPVQARFQGNIHLSELDPPNGYTISGEGSGGPAGSAKGLARVRLETDGNGTRLSWTADAQVSGKLAQIGSRLVESTANIMAGQFFDRFVEVVQGKASPSKPVRLVPLWVWIAAVSLLAALALFLRMR